MGNRSGDIGKSATGKNAAQALGLFAIAAVLRRRARQEAAKNGGMDRRCGIG